MTTSIFGKKFFLLFTFICISLFTSKIFAVDVLGDYRSLGSGVWSDITKWERYDGATWVAATTAPTYTDNVITIRSPHVITTDIYINVDQLVVTFGGTLNLDFANGLLSDGAGVDLTINGIVNHSSLLTGSSLCSVQVSGTGKFYLKGQSWFFDTVVNSGGEFIVENNTNKTLSETLTINGGGILNFNFEGEFYLNNATIDNSGTIKNSGDVKFKPDVGMANLIINKSGANFNKLTGSTFTSFEVPFTNNGTLTLSANTKLVSTSTFTNTGNISVMPMAELEVTGGTFAHNSGTFSVLGTLTISNITLVSKSTLNNTGNITVNSGATLEVSGGMFTHSSGTFNVIGTLTTISSGIFNHNSAINFGGSSVLNAGGIYNLNVDQSFGINAINITGMLNVAVTKTLTWSSGNITFDMGTLNNNGTIDNSFNGNILNSSSGLLFNSGIYTKSAGGGISKIEIDFTNNGTININSGTLQFEGTLINSASKTINVNTGASFKNTNR